ncbi:MAG TPA: hypothetical protein PLO89_07385, partial [Spirochaetota bacterium]|nr:hypothetical protein [Spirochaetota bacterium]
MMVVCSYVKKNLFGLNKEVFLSNSPKYSDVLVSSDVKRVKDISRKQKNASIVFLTKKRYKNIPKNVFVYDKFDFFENVLIYNNIKAFSLNLREKYFYKVKSYLTKNNKLNSIKSILKNLGFLSLTFRDYTSFLNYLGKKDYVLDGEKVHFKVVSKNLENEVFRIDLKQNLVGFFIIREGKVYFFKYLISPKSIFYKKIFNALLKIVKNLRFFKKKRFINKTPLQSIGLREKERFFASHIGEGFFIQDSTGKITFVNNILKKMLINYNISFGYLEKLFLDKYLSLSIKKERSFNFNFEINNPIEGKHYFEINYSPIKSGGEILSYCAIIRDVTLQK